MEIVEEKEEDAEDEKCEKRVEGDACASSQNLFGLGGVADLDEALDGHAQNEETVGQVTPNVNHYTRVYVAENFVVEPSSELVKTDLFDSVTREIAMEGCWMLRAENSSTLS